MASSKPLQMILGPCVIESEQFIMDVAGQIQEIVKEMPIDWVFKSSFDKANRTSGGAFRGPGIDKGLEILAKVKKEYGLSILTDIHLPDQAQQVAQVADILQIPAFLCRQTDLIEAAAQTGKALNIKKGQFLSPVDMAFIAEKAQHAGATQVYLCERGSSFGYNNLVVDMRGIKTMKESGYPVIFDATHSVQEPGGISGHSGGKREYVPILARCAITAGVDGVFAEVHPNPESAPCDGPNMLPMKDLKAFIEQLLAFYELRQNMTKTSFDSF